MELQHFFIFIGASIGIPIFVALFLKSKKISKKVVKSLESGLVGHSRKTNRHKNNYFTLSLFFLFLTLGISILVMLNENFAFGRENWKYYILSVWILVVMIFSYFAIKISGGIKLDD